MSSPADIRSLSGLENFLSQCQSTRESVLKEIENLQAELQRLTGWLNNDVERYWRSELKMAERYQTECQDALLRCQAAVRVSEQRPCTEQHKRLERAKERRAFCERQVRVVAEAQLAWERAGTKMASKIFRCRDLAESDLSAAIIHLRERLKTLEEYTNLRSGALNHLDSSPASPAISTSSEFTNDVTNGQGSSGSIVPEKESP